MVYSVLLHPKANEALNSLEKSIRSRVNQRLIELKEAPEEKGTRLKYTDYWSIRVGDYRAIYEIKPQDKQVIVLYIGHRKNVYDDFSKII